MKLVLLGTGGPEQNPARVSQSSLLITQGRHMLVDAGRGAINQLSQVGAKVHDVDQILITHHHYDHIGDLGVLLLTSWSEGRKAPIRVVGPPGTGDIVTALLDVVYAADIRWRQAEDAAWAATSLEAGEGILQDPEAMVEIHEVIDGPVVADEALTIRAAESEHGRTYLKLDDWHSVAYRIEAEGKSVVFSGDTALTAGLVTLAAGADTLVLNCYASEAEVTTPWAWTFSQTMIASSRECGRIAAAAGVRQLVLSHFGAAMTFDSVESDVREHYSGSLIIGADLMAIEI
jgi:ribonuclease BN (tRNA processing enzyme)